MVYKIVDIQLDNTMNTILIPASGSATRMRGLPKFLLPSGKDNLSLLENHIANVSNFASEILIGLNPIFLDIVLQANLALHGASIIPMKTANMTQTVLNLAKLSASDRYTVIMPDTAFEAKESYQFQFLHNDLDLSLWKIRSDQYGKLGQVSLDSNNNVLDCVDKDPTCKYELAWGALTFNQKFLKFLHPDFPHIGYGIVPALKAKLNVKGVVIDGSYWDCGTPEEYIRYLRSGEI
jgi:hypothetical protein